MEAVPVVEMTLRGQSKSTSITAFNRCHMTYLLVFHSNFVYIYCIVSKTYWQLAENDKFFQPSPALEAPLEFHNNWYEKS